MKSNAMAASIILFHLSAMLHGAEPIAHWSFDRTAGQTAIDQASGIKDSVAGHFRYLPAVRGTGLKFDEFSTYVYRPVGKSPQLNPEAFSFEAWIAPQAYPWNWTPIVMQRRDNRGYLFGINYFGQIGLSVGTGTERVQCVSEQKVPFMQWSHVAATCDAEQGISLYINGKLDKRLPVKLKLKQSESVELRIGRNTEQQQITAAVDNLDPNKQGYFDFSFDGMMDEIKIYNEALDTETVAEHYASAKPATPFPLEWRKMPTGPTSDRFEASELHLEYDEDFDRHFEAGALPAKPFPKLDSDFDRHFRDSKDQDIVINFADQSYKLVFWHGTRNYPCWVTDNDIWYMQEAAEDFSTERQCWEAMLDFHCRLNRVRLVEDSEARKVVYWSHGLVTGTRNEPYLGDWCHMVYTIYPDGVAVRKIVLYTGDTARSYRSMGQPNFLLNPGVTPEDIIPDQPVTAMNLAGESKRYAYRSDKNAELMTDPANANIVVYHFRGTEQKAFVILPPQWSRAPKMLHGPNSKQNFATSKHMWWNHYPVGMAPSPGAVATQADRPTSTCTGALGWHSFAGPAFEKTETSISGCYLDGMIDGDEKQLVDVARAWVNPPELEASGPGFESTGYQKHERAYSVTCKQPGRPIELSLLGSPAQSICNPAFVIHNWGEADPKLFVDSSEIPRGSRFRYAKRPSAGQTDLVVWIELNSERKTRLVLLPARQE